MEINTICVCGAGTMGSGIAQVAAQSGFYTLLYDLNPEMLDKAKAGIERSLQKSVEREKISVEEKQQALERISFTSDLQTCLADLFIEAVVEKLPVKISLFNQLAELNHSECIFASNTSSLSITEIANGVIQPSRVIGLHFFNPAPLMKLVEIVTTPHTVPGLAEIMVKLTQRMGKTPVVCKDSPGFIVNRVARPYYIESLRLIEEEKTNFKQLDQLLEATGFKMGPFKLMDLIGNDINYAVSCSVYEQMHQPERLRPSYVQKQKVEEGKLGQKAGIGYYEYR
ncbi:3-hydroxyacyl-CoA dehydrogenase NAD-binding domain-containing protein [Terrimonas sp. NA20]|uniref:3-hydroxyacyl-CoA dehydrogenase NAD-binding domain-containing protein n=1 Tax=Terrimonas ginsenosidimutans TaxID=2908004 RepID=A0ABS9KZ81_9BACT|nr:3-hydroxyacyl-CoA dehydrogenase NAD-binding domain-containing protein [Terrimonas ginsenosidimutans]